MLGMGNMIATSRRRGVLALVLSTGLLPATAHAAGQKTLIVLPLHQVGTDLSLAQTKQLSDRLSGLVSQSQTEYGEQILTDPERTALWSRLQAELRVDDDGGEIDALMGSADALLYGQVGSYRIVLNLKPRHGRIRRAQKLVARALAGQRLAQVYSKALDETVRALIPVTESSAVNILFDDTTIAGLDPHDVIRKDQVLHRSRLALEAAVRAVNQSNNTGRGGSTRKLVLADPKSVHSYRCWLQVDYKGTIIMDCEKARVGGSVLFWQAALTDLVPWEQLIPLAARVYDDATGRPSEEIVRRAERVAFLVDNSSSLIVNDYVAYVNDEPRQSRRYHAVESLSAALGGLQNAPEVGILVFAGVASQRWIGWFDASDRHKRERALSELGEILRRVSRGGTDIAAALTTVAEKSGGPAAMILLTDGAQSVLPGPQGLPAMTGEELEQALRYVVDVAQSLHRRGLWRIHVVNMQIIDLEGLRNAVEGNKQRVDDYWSRAQSLREDEVQDVEGFISEINAGNLKVGDLGVLAEIAGPGTCWQAQSDTDDTAILEGDLFGVLRLPLPRIHVLCGRQDEYETIVCDVPYLKPGANPLVVRNHFYDRICSARVAKLSRGARTTISFHQPADDTIELDVEVEVSGTAEAGNIGNVDAEFELRYVPAGRTCP